MPEREYLVPNETILDLTVAMNCIMCGACVSDCTSLEVDKNFIGRRRWQKPTASLTTHATMPDWSAWKISATTAGVYDCTHCFFLR